MKEIFANARSGDQYRVLKISIEDGKTTPGVYLQPSPSLCEEKADLFVPLCVKEISAVLTFYSAHICLSEQLTLDGTRKASKKWDQEYDSLVLPLLEDAVPCYILYRLDTTNNQGYEWILLAWSPDHSTVREPRLVPLMNSCPFFAAFVVLCFG